MVRYAPIVIKDKPGFPYRGVMLDTSRQFYTKDKVKEIILSEALGKLNVFHWHLNDDDSFPFESADYPDLTDYTAFSDLEVYSIEDVNEITEYGELLGVKVIPEIEGMAHLHSLGLYPNFTHLIGCFSDP